MAWTLAPEQAAFIRRYAKSVDSGDAAIFAGAGLSRAAGFVDWKALLREIAEDLGLDVDRETDLIALAQYHVNEKRNRGRINQTIMEELAGSATSTRAHAILARLPLPTVWTTNYDQVLEAAFEDAGKIVDLKTSQANLAQTRRGRDVVIYKMHGCVTQPQDAVITKDDYEQYERNRPLFVESLKGDLIAKTFLFLGFSFTDPNVDYILSRVRVLLGTNVREHFCVMRQPKRPARLAGKAKADYEYEVRRTQLRQQDLLRFGIETVWVDEFEHVTPLLAALSSFIHRKSVFVSGAALDRGPLPNGRLEDLARRTGSRLIDEGYNLVSGFGLGLGEECTVGALHALYGAAKGSELDRLFIRPFPRSGSGDQKTQNTRHREELLSRAGIVVVLSGNKAASGGGTQISPGVLEEVEIALRDGKRVIPVGATGHAARQVWLDATAHPDRYLPGVNGSRELKTLGNAGATNDQLINALFRLLAKAEKAASV